MPDAAFRDSERFRIIGEIQDAIKEIRKTLFHGNGKPGVCTRLELLEGAVDRIESTLSDFKKIAAWLVALVLSAVILQIVNLVIKH